MIHLFSSGKTEDYDVTINDPYSKINRSISESYQAPNYNRLVFNKKSDDADNLNGLEHVIRLKEVKISSINDNSLYGKTGMMANACGDYVCMYDILNCPNHRFNSSNRLPIRGDSYYQLDVFTGMMRKLVYQGCSVNQDKQPATTIDGIKYSMEFYPSDYLKYNPSEPEYLSTIYWKHLYKINPGNNADITFFKGDIKGAFKIIVQGICENDVISAKKSFIVTKP
jgi:hypothetical protein